MAHCQHSHRNAIIRNPKSGLVLEGSRYEVKLQHFTGFPSQLWTLEPSESGNFVIVNRGNGKALDIRAGGRSGSSVITYPKHGSNNQQWFVNSDDSIVSASDNLALDVLLCQGSCHAGAHIIVFPKHGGENQRFRFEYH